jgi:hypothetical protein
VMTDEAVINDNFALPKIHQQLSQSELLPNVHVLDFRQNAAGSLTTAAPGLVVMCDQNQTNPGTS